MRHLNPGNAGAVLALDSRFINGLSDGDPVSTWADRSGQGNNATGSGSARPTFQISEQGGNPAIRFDGNDDIIEYTGLISTIPAYIFTVVNLKATYDSFAAVIHNGNGGLNGYGHIFYQGNITLLRGGISFDIDGAQSIGTTFLWSSKAFADTSSLGWISGYAVSYNSTGGGGINTPSAGGSIGNNGQTDIYQCVISVNINDTLRRRLEHAAAFSFKIACQ